MLEKYRELKKTDQNHSKFDPELKVGKQVGMGAETRVFKSELGYKKKTVPGFVYKKIHQSDVSPQYGRLQMEDMLRKWTRIKKIKKELIKNHQEGFNIPSTVRSYRDKEGAGILMTDLSRGGKLSVIDLKDLPLLQKAQWRVEEWRKIRKAVLRDVDIAIKSNIDLSGGPFPLDPWVLVENPKSDEYDIYIVDIGGYVSMYYSLEAGSQILGMGREKVVKALDRMEEEIFKEE